MEKVKLLKTEDNSMNKNKKHEIVDISKVEKCKQVILNENPSNTDCGIYYMREPHYIKDDWYYKAYDAEDLIIEVCPYDSTVEVYGLNNLEFKALKRWYDELQQERIRKFVEENHRRLQEYYAALEEERRSKKDA